MYLWKVFCSSGKKQFKLFLKTIKQDENLYLTEFIYSGILLMRLNMYYEFCNNFFIKER